MSHKYKAPAFIFISRNPKTCAGKMRDNDLIPKLEEYRLLISCAFHRLNSSSPKSNEEHLNGTQKDIVMWLTKSSIHFKFLVTVALEMCLNLAYSNENRENWLYIQKEIEEIKKNIPQNRLFRVHYFEDPPQHLPLTFQTTDAVEAYKDWYENPTGRKKRKTRNKKRQCNSYNCDWTNLVTDNGLLDFDFDFDIIT